jgi:hypothetical protein
VAVAEVITLNGLALRVDLVVVEVHSMRVPALVAQRLRDKGSEVEMPQARVIETSLLVLVVEVLAALVEMPVTHSTEGVTADLVPSRQYSG